MRIVYLDQNKWIELAQASLGRSKSQHLREVLEILRGARDLNLACFPVAFSHYIETHKHRNPERRASLAAFMRDMSGGLTIAAYPHLIRYEIDAALYKRFPGRVTPDHLASLNLLGKGLSHAAGIPRFRLVLPDADLTGDQAKLWRLIKAQIEDIYEEDMLSGTSRFTGEEAPRADLSAPELAFKQHLDQLASRLQPLDAETRERVLHATALVDIVQPLNEALVRHSISWIDFLALGEDGVSDFVEDLPTKRLDIGLQREWAKNSGLRAKRSELIDWGQVGPMVMYCDVVVTEKLFADLVKRTRIEHRAAVLTNLRHLPSALLHTASAQ